MKIPKEIADKIVQRNKLVEEVNKWFIDNVDTDGMYIEGSMVVSEPSGEAQGDGEYCDQMQHDEDTFSGSYFYPIEGNAEYVRIDYWC